MDFLDEPEINDNGYFTDDTTYSFDTGNNTIDSGMLGSGAENQQYSATDNYIPTIPQTSTAESYGGTACM